MAHPIAWWRARSARKQAEAEARQLRKEARRILKKKSYRIPESVASAVNKAIEDVDTALDGHDAERLRESLSRLDEQMDKHLGFARKSTLREYAESIGVAVAVALLLRAFVVEAFQIPSGSMIPTLEVGDHIFVSKFAYGLSIPFTNTKILEWRQPQRGDVIVFKYPKDNSVDYIKRVVGLPGDTVEVRRNEVFINGVPVPREYIAAPCSYVEVQSATGIKDRHECELWMESLDSKRHPTYYEHKGSGTDFGRTEAAKVGMVGGVIPPGSVFVMGDNRDNSSDSRFWGTVSHELIKGKALVIWWSRAASEGMSWDSIRWRRFFHAVE